MNKWEVMAVWQSLWYSTQILKYFDDIWCGRGDCSKCWWVKVLLFVYITISTSNEA